jgi:general stress protein 26
MEAANTTEAHLGELLEGIDIAMLTTVGAQGHLVSRPLSTQQAEYRGTTLWFLTEADSPKVAEIRRQPKVNLAYASKEKNTYVSISGKARTFHDQAKIDELWSDAMKAFFPKGRTDPNLVLLEVEARTVEYWDGPGSFLGKLVTFIVARVTHNEEVMGENRIIDLSGKRVSSRRPPSSKGSKPASAAAKKALTKPRKSATKTAAKAGRKAAVKPAKAAPRKSPTKAAAKKTARPAAKKAVKKTPAKKTRR